MQLILASSSPTRKKILESLGLDFKVIPSHIDESKISATNPKLLVQKIAKAKCEAVFRKSTNQLINQSSNQLQESSHARHSELGSESPVIKILKSIKKENRQVHNNTMSTDAKLILAADSMVVLGNQTIGKPKDKKEAKQILKQLSGKTHSFITGLYLINTKTNKAWQKLAETKVTFRNLSNEEIDDYISKTDVTRFAGGYAIIPPEDFNLKTIKNNKSNIIKKISGSITNVMGLPIEILLLILKENGV